MNGFASLSPFHSAFRLSFLGACTFGLAIASCTPAAKTRLTLRNVVLYQNGIGYFEHRGVSEGARVDLSFRRYEIGDVLKTITIVPVGADGRVGGSAVAALTTSTVPDETAGASADNDEEGTKSRGPEVDPAEQRIALSVALTAAARDLAISYAVPTPAWKPSYRIVLPEQRGAGEALLQGWATINNTSDADWRDVQLTLATGAPLSFAIDLLTPRFVARPDLTGTLIKPVAIGAIGSSSAQSGDSDGDGTADLDDLCPDEAEDRDGFEDGDGCPDPDNDKDRILDAQDQCPNDPEVYNGVDDDDGCPDRGRVIVSDSNIEILDKVYFKAGSAKVRKESMPIVDAIAATLHGNPDIAVLEVQGHAASDETGAWNLSRRRAAAVRALLLERGVATELRAAPYGATQPIDARATENARAKNRRVEFLILKRRDDEPVRTSSGSGMPRVTSSDVQGSVRARVEPRDVAGTVRYEIADPVTIPRGSSALVPIINQKVAGEDIFLFRPDGDAPASARHPWRAARIDNQTGLELQPGPVAIFSDGAFVGEGLLERLHDREVAFVPYAIDSSCTITRHSDRGEKPVRIVTVSKGVVMVHNRETGHHPLRNPHRRQGSGPGHHPPRADLRVRGRRVAAADPGHRHPVSGPRAHPGRREERARDRRETGRAPDHSHHGLPGREAAGGVYRGR